METTKQGGRRLTPEEAREMGRRGGVKSGESRRRKKYLRGCMLRLLRASGNRCGEKGRAARHGALRQRNVEPDAAGGLYF